MLVLSGLPICPQDSTATTPEMVILNAVQGICQRADSTYKKRKYVHPRRSDSLAESLESLMYVPICCVSPYPQLP